jgi:hypothetical protein
MPTIMTTLADKALLVKLNRSLYQPYVFDAKATRMVEEASGVTKAGRYNKRLFRDSSVLKDTNEKFNLLYVTYIKRTVPWLDDGVRMVPNALYFELAHELRDLIVDAKAAADALARQWGAMVASDIQLLGAMANPADYCTAEEVRAKFDAQVTFFPVPSAADFRIDVTEEDRAEMAKAISDAEANVGKYLMKEMLAPVKAFVNKLSVPIGLDGAIFRDTLIENIVDLVERLPKLNINRDPDVDATIAELKSVIDHFADNPDVLRESQDTRQSARDKMAVIEAKMAAFMGA